MSRRQQLSDRRHFVTQWMLDNFWRLLATGKTNPEYTRRKFDQVSRLTTCIDLGILIYEEDHPRR